MNNQLLNEFISKVNYVYSSDMENTFHPNYKESIYKTSFNDLNVEVVMRKNPSLLQSACIINFKNKENNQIFSILLSNDSKDNYVTYKYDAIKMGNYITKDSEIVNALLNKVGFVEFVNSELKTMNNILASVIPSTPSEPIIDSNHYHNNTVLTFISHLNNEQNIDTTDLFKNIIDMNYHNSKAAKYFYNESYETNKDKVLIHKEHFNDCNIKHSMTYVSDRILHEVNIVNEEDGINVTLETSPANAYEKVRYGKIDIYKMKIGNEAIDDANIINHVVKFLKVDEYFEKSLKTVQIYKEADDMKNKIHYAVQERVVLARMQDIVNSDLTQPIQYSQVFSTMPVTLNGLSGSKVWLNENYELHKEDGPAVETAQGLEYWFKNGAPFIPEGQLDTLHNKYSSAGKFVDNSNTDKLISELKVTLNIDDTNTRDNNHTTADLINENNRLVNQITETINEITGSVNENITDKKRTSSLMQRMKNKIFPQSDNHNTPSV